MAEIKSLKRKMNTNLQDFSSIKGSILSEPNKFLPFPFSFYKRELNDDQLLSFTAKCNFWIRKYRNTLILRFSFLTDYRMFFTLSLWHAVNGAKPLLTCPEHLNYEMN